MARARSPNRDKAFLIYKEHNGSINLVKIAEALEVSPGTIRGWKNKDQWDSKINGTFRKNEVKNTERSKRKVNKNIVKKEPVLEEVEEIIENSELTDNQRLFCIYYIKCFNATKAYKKAYKCSYETANVEGYKTLVKPSIKEEILKLKQHKLNRVMITEDDIFQRYMDIAFADIGDYLSFKKKRKNLWSKDDKGNDVPIIDPDTREQKYIEYNVVELNDSKGLDTTLLSEVSEGKDGVKIKLQDKMKAMQWLGDRMDLIPTVVREKLQIEKDKLKQLQEKIDYEKNKDNKGDEPIEIIIKRKSKD